MPRLRNRAATHAPFVMQAEPYLEYLVQPRQDVWFIVYEGDDFGPYASAREAMLFAVDVAHRLGERGKDTRVKMMDSTGHPCSTWTYGVDCYPPRL